MTFDNIYENGNPPWDLGKPQQAFVDVFSEGQISGTVLDIGCGTGDNALFLTEKGLVVTGIDSSSNAIKKAILKTAEKYICSNLTFRIQNLFDLNPVDNMYDTVIDSGVFHIFDNKKRIKYQEVVHSILQPKGQLLILVFSEKEPFGIGPPYRITKNDLNFVFKKELWEIESIRDEKFELKHSNGFAQAYLAIIRKI